MGAYLADRHRAATERAVAPAAPSSQPFAGDVGESARSSGHVRRLQFHIPQGSEHGAVAALDRKLTLRDAGALDIEPVGTALGCGAVGVGACTEEALKAVGIDLLSDRVGFAVAHVHESGAGEVGNRDSRTVAEVGTIASTQLGQFVAEPGEGIGELGERVFVLVGEIA